jgi:pimeloyl-ACP methyl ester carboxylesterase
MAVVRDFLMAGDHYRPAYAAAFRYDPLPALSQSSTPTIHATRDTDLLVSHLDRLPESASKAGMVHRLKGSDLDEWAGAIGNLIEGYPGTADLRHDQDWAPVQGQGMAVHNADAGPLYVHFAGNPGHGTTLLIHDSPGSAVAQQRLIGSLAEEGRVVAPELPGHGWSPPLADVDDHRLAISDRIAEALGALSVGAPVRIIGLGLGGAVAFELAKKFEVPLILLNPPRPDVKPNSYAPALTDSWYGGHLLAAFYQARDAMIYDPWYDRRQECARAMDPDPDMAALFAAFRDIVLSENGYRTLAMEALDDRRWIDAGQSLISADRPDALDLANALGGVVVASTEEAVAQIRTIAA